MLKHSVEQRVRIYINTQKKNIQTDVDMLVGICVPLMWAPVHCDGSLQPALTMSSWLLFRK